MGLFEPFSRPQKPLAARMRPQRLAEMVGQNHLLAKNGLLWPLLKQRPLPALLLWGPPGCGKTTLGQAIAHEVGYKFIPINAVSATVMDLRKVVADHQGTDTILFIDEIHRFSKSQQDVLLPVLEDALITIIGATTENPYATLTPAFLSRSRVLELLALSEVEIRQVLEDAVRKEGHVMPDSIFAVVQNYAGGDVRLGLNAVEQWQSAGLPQDPQEFRRLLGRPPLRYDKDGNQHYDVVSAFIKSIRGSDPNAALYWLAAMMAGGEDPRFIARRLVILAAEDIGLAAPEALSVASSAFLAVEKIGMPEGRLPLAEATLYLALCPKSNAVISAVDKALAHIEAYGIGEVPLHLRDAHSTIGRQQGHGADYLYPHDYPGHYVSQQYLPTGVQANFTKPGQQGLETKLWQRLLATKQNTKGS